ncbi:MAG: Fe-S cluster assembly protein SufD [Thermoanaerobaculia bacterium]
MRTEVEAGTLQQIREQAAQRFEQLGWPTPRLEAWKYTNLAQVAKVEWKHAGRSVAAGALARRAGEGSLAGATVELQFLNGRFAEMHGKVPAGVRVVRMGEAQDDPVFQRHFSRYADYQDHALTAMNTANFEDGAFIEVSPNALVEGFIHLVFTGEGDEVASHPRNLIVVGRAAQVSIVETFAGSGRYFTNTVTEIVAGDGAVVDHAKIQCESLDAFHVGTVQVHQERSSNVTARSFCVGGALVRNETNAALKGEGASLSLEGLFVLRGSQHADNHTIIDHVMPRCESHELYKGVLDESSRGIFDGTIIVRPDAQKTVSRQVNKNLLLSETAIVDSKPTLEIHNDDVKCNHGSTIGQLEEEPMFYLRSRGLGEEEARSLLVYAFASEIVDRIRIEPVREQVRRVMFQQLADRLPEGRGATR